MGSLVDDQEINNPFFNVNFDRFSASSYDGSSPPARRILNRHPVGEAGILAGEGGVGKSFLALIEMEEASSRGVTCIGLFSEDSRATIDHRLKTIRDKSGWKHGAKSLYIPTSDIEEDCTLIVFDPFRNDVVKTHLFEWLEIRLESIKAAGEDAIVIIDNFTTLIRVEGNKAEQAGMAMAMLNNLAQRTGSCVYVIHHLNKATTADHRNRIRGSGGLVDQGRFAQVLSKTDDVRTGEIREKLGLAGDAEIVTIQTVKSNGGMKQGSRHFVREGDGFLRELPRVEFVQDADALVQLVRESAARGVFFTKSGKHNGLYACREASWPGRIGSLSKGALQNLAGQLITSGKLRVGDDGILGCCDA